MISTLKTVCIAGRAASGFNGDCNARLDQLVEDGLLVLELTLKSKIPGRAYTPTEKGKELVRQLSNGAVETAAHTMDPAPLR